MKGGYSMGALIGLLVLLGLAGGFLVLALIAGLKVASDEDDRVDNEIRQRYLDNKYNIK